jgi:hypothetical protein
MIDLITLINLWKDYDDMFIERPEAGTHQVHPDKGREQNQWFPSRNLARTPHATCQQLRIGHEERDTERGRETGGERENVTERQREEKGAKPADRERYRPFLKSCKKRDRQGETGRTSVQGAITCCGCLTGPHPSRWP